MLKRVTASNCTEDSEPTMQTWQKASTVTLITLAIGGIYLFTIFQHRRNPGVVPNSAAAPATNLDDNALVLLKYLTTFVNNHATSIQSK